MARRHSVLDDSRVRCGLVSGRASGTLAKKSPAILGFLARRRRDLTRVAHSLAWMVRRNSGVLSASGQSLFPDYSSDQPTGACGGCHSARPNYPRVQRA